VDWCKLDIGKHRLHFTERGIALTLNGIAQGYATDRALAALDAHGIANALVDAGEIGVRGTKAERQPWHISIDHPRDPAALLGAMRGDGRGIATSGAYATTFSTNGAYAKAD
jgi:FAD:protein FMN transferase